MNQCIFILLLFSIGSQLTNGGRICYNTTSNNYTIVVRFNRLYGDLLSIGDTTLRISDGNIRILDEIFQVYSICRCQTRGCLYEELSFNVNLTSSDIALTCNAGSAQRVAHTEQYPSRERLICHPTSDNNTGHDRFSAVVISFSIDGEVKNQTNWTSLCNDTTCNGGRCFSPYKQEVICDCSTTIGNGSYCFGECSVKEVGTRNYTMEPEVLKISMGYPVPSLSIYGPIHSISLGVDPDDTLRLELSKMVDSRHCKIERYMITEHFNRLSDSIVLLTFGKNNVSIKFFNGSTWDRGSITEVPWPPLPQFHHISIKESGRICVAWRRPAKYRLWDVDLEMTSKRRYPFDVSFNGSNAGGTCILPIKQQGDNKEHIVVSYPVWMVPVLAGTLIVSFFGNILQLCCYCYRHSTIPTEETDESTSHDQSIQMIKKKKQKEGPQRIHEIPK